MPSIYLSLLSLKVKQLVLLSKVPSFPIVKTICNIVKQLVLLLKAISLQLWKLILCWSAYVDIPFKLVDIDEGIARHGDGSRRLQKVVLPDPSRSFIFAVFISEVIIISFLQVSDTNVPSSKDFHLEPKRYMRLDSLFLYRSFPDSHIPVSQPRQVQPALESNRQSVW